MGASKSKQKRYYIESKNPLSKKELQKMFGVDKYENTYWDKKKLKYVTYYDITKWSKIFIIWFLFLFLALLVFITGGIITTLRLQSDVESVRESMVIHWGWIEKSKISESLRKNYNLTSNEINNLSIQLDTNLRAVYDNFREYRLEQNDLQAITGDTSFYELTEDKQLEIRKILATDIIDIIIYSEEDILVGYIDKARRDYGLTDLQIVDIGMIGYDNVFEGYNEAIKEGLTFDDMVDIANTNPDFKKVYGGSLYTDFPQKSFEYLLKAGNEKDANLRGVIIGVEVGAIYSSPIWGMFIISFIIWLFQNYSLSSSNKANPN
jgi:hypothetical protein